MAGKTATGTGLAELGGAVGVVALGAGLEATVGRTVEVVGHCAFINLGAIGGSAETTDALQGAGLANIGVTGSSVLPQRTF